MYDLLKFEAVCVVNMTSDSLSSSLDAHSK